MSEAGLGKWTWEVFGWSGPDKYQRTDTKLESATSLPHSGRTSLDSYIQCQVKRDNPKTTYSSCSPRILCLTQAWESLEEAEYQRELALRSELIRQEKLEQLARRFDRKAAMRETWLNENQRLVTQVRGTAWQRGEVL